VRLRAERRVAREAERPPLVAVQRPRRRRAQRRRGGLGRRELVEIEHGDVGLGAAPHPGDRAPHRARHPGLGERDDQVLLSVDDVPAGQNPSPIDEHAAADRRSWIGRGEQGHGPRIVTGPGEWRLSHRRLPCVDTSSAECDRLCHKWW
jgi:hypothetical protein